MSVQIQRDMQWLCRPANRGRHWRDPGTKRVGDWLLKRMASYGYVSESRGFLRGGSRSPTKNIVCYPRNPNGVRPVCLMAHYDHLGVHRSGAVYAGANDNASGVAVLLYLARRLATKRRDVIFLFTTGEEEGLLGAKAAVRQRLVPKSAFVINFDMVGEPVPLILDGVLPSGVAQAVREAARDSRLNLDVVDKWYWGDRADYAPFLRAGYEAACISSRNDGRAYHTPEDKLDTISFDQVLDVGKLTLRVIRAYQDT